MARTRVIPLIVAGVALAAATDLLTSGTGSQRRLGPARIATKITDASQLLRHTDLPFQLTVTAQVRNVGARVVKYLALSAPDPRSMGSRIWWEGVGGVKNGESSYVAPGLSCGLNTFGGGETCTVKYGLKLGSSSTLQVTEAFPNSRELRIAKRTRAKVTVLAKPVLN
jgi:hypothetical protein